MYPKLGQVPLSFIPGLTSPFASYTPAYQAAAPSGAPLYTAQINDPDFANTERHCYRCPDGSFKSMTIPAARAAGCEARPLSECGSTGGLSGVARRALGKMRLAQTPAAPAPAPMMPVRPSIIAAGGLAAFALGSHFVPKKYTVAKGALVLGAVLSGLAGGYFLYAGQ
jgi:hypothetical protein